MARYRRSLLKQLLRAGQHFVLNTIDTHMFFSLGLLMLQHGAKVHGSHIPPSLLENLPKSGMCKKFNL